MFALGAALKWCTFRSTDQYLGLAELEAERAGAEISTAICRALIDVTRSCMRGLGPPKRCEGLVSELLGNLPGGRDAWAAGGPVNPRSALTLGAWWMLREIEFSNAELRAVQFNTVRLIVSWMLPASKTDPHALGETVSHGCCCRSATAWSNLCPYH